MILIHIIHATSALDYEKIIRVESYKASTKHRGAAVIIRHHDRDITVPLSNISAIEET